MLTGELATGDIEGDLLDRLARRLPRIFWVEGDKANAWTGPEVPPGGVVVDEAWFLEFTTARDQVHNDGSMRELDFQLLRRFTRNDRAAKAKARKEIFAAYDELRLMPAVDGVTGFTGAKSGGSYAETRTLAPPLLLEDRYFSLNFTAWRPR